MNRTAKECDWLREFDVAINRPDVTDHDKVAWDWLPQDWTRDEAFLTGVYGLPIRFL